MKVVEYSETKMNTPISPVAIHSSLPHWTVKTGTIVEIPSWAVLRTPAPHHSTIVNGTTYPLCADNTIKDYFATLSLSSIQASAQEKKNRRYVEYLSEFSRNWDLKNHPFKSFIKDFVWDKFKIAIDQLLQLKPDYVSFNLTDDHSIFFKSVAKGNNIYLELFFDEDSQENVEAIANVYKDGKVALAYGGNMEDTFGEIQKLFPTKDKVTVPTSIPNAISSAYFATAEF
jgi:hypothetical protein